MPPPPPLSCKQMDTEWDNEKGLNSKHCKYIVLLEKYDQLEKKKITIFCINIRFSAIIEGQDINH